MSVGPIYITAYRACYPKLKITSEKWLSGTPFGTEIKRETGHKSGPEARGWERKGDENERGEGVGLPCTTFGSSWLPRNRRRPAASEGTGCACVAKGTTNESGSWQGPSRASHERPERGCGLGPPDPNELVRGLGLFYRARVSQKS